MIIEFFHLLLSFKKPEILDVADPVAVHVPDSVNTEKRTEPDTQLLADLIGDVESTSAGGYNAANAGSAMDLGRNGLIKLTGRPCDQITIREIKAWQRRGLLYAAGRYQLIPRTLKAAVQWAKLSDDEYFSPSNQDKLLDAILEHKRPAVWRYLTEGTSLNAAVNALAKEWAGLPTLSGSSYYRRGNRAHTTVPAVVSALDAARIW